MMTTEIFEDADHLFPLKDEWNHLAEHKPVSMTYDWLMAWWNCYKEPNYQLRVYSLWDNNRLVAIFPLMLVDDGNMILRFISTNCSDYLSVLVNNDYFDKIDCLFESVLDDQLWDSLVLENIKRDDVLLNRFMLSLCEKHNCFTVANQDEIYSISIDKPWDDFLRTRTRNTRHAYSQAARKSDLFYFHLIQHYSNDVLFKITEMHKRRWFDVDSVSTFFDDRRIAFVNSVSQSFSSSGKLAIFLLEFNKEIVAYRYGFICDSTYYDWNTSFNIDYSSYSCGKILLKNIYQYCYMNGISKIDFMRGSEKYKQIISTDRSFLVKLICHRQREVIEEMPPKERIKSLVSRTKGIVFDLDGVVYSGNKPIEGTVHAIKAFQNEGVIIGFLTNTSSKTNEEISKKLISMGVDTTGSFIMTSASATARFLLEQNITSCYVLGGGMALINALKCAKVRIITDYSKKTEDNNSAVVIAYTEEITYDQLTMLANLIISGHRFICTDKDSKYSYNGDWKPGTGWIVAALEYITGIKATIIGKPETHSLSYLISDMGVSKDELLIVGDNLDTDICVAKRAGISSCLLLGGISTLQDVARLKTELRPELVVDSLVDLIEYYKEDKND